METRNLAAGFGGGVVEQDFFDESVGQVCGRDTFMRSNTHQPNQSLSEEG
jgi:hypothetical protein